MTDLEANPPPPPTLGRAILEFGVRLFAGTCAVFATVALSLYALIGFLQLLQWFVDPFPRCGTGYQVRSADDWMALSFLLLPAVFAKYSVLTPRRLRKIASWCLDGQIAVWLVGFALNENIILVLLYYYDHWIRYR